MLLLKKIAEQKPAAALLIFAARLGGDAYYPFRTYTTYSGTQEDNIAATQVICMKKINTAAKQPQGRTLHSYILAPFPQQQLRTYVQLISKSATTFVLKELDLGAACVVVVY